MLTNTLTPSLNSRLSLVARAARRGGILLALMLAACDAGEADDGEAPADVDVVVGEGDLIVAGAVERTSSATALNDAFVPTAAAHVTISVREYVGEDAAAPLVAEADVPFTGELPFTYEVRGDVDAEALADATLIVSVRMYNHAGDELAVGDLMSDTFISAELGQADVAVDVQGLESCSDAAAGGSCASE
jgi:hypothetical protein